MPGGMDAFIEKYMKELEVTDEKVAQMLQVAGVHSYEKNDDDDAPLQKMSLEELESELKEIITKIKEEEVPMVEVKRFSWFIMIRTS